MLAEVQLTHKLAVVCVGISLYSNVGAPCRIAGQQNYWLCIVTCSRAGYCLIKRLWDLKNILQQQQPSRQQSARIHKYPHKVTKIISCLIVHVEAALGKKHFWRWMCSMNNSLYPELHFSSVDVKAATTFLWGLFCGHTVMILSWIIMMVCTVGRWWYCSFSLLLANSLTVSQIWGMYY